MNKPNHWSWHGQDIRDEFRGDFFNPDRRLTSIGSGFIGAKAAGLAFIEDILRSKLPRRVPNRSKSAFLP